MTKLEHKIQRAIKVKKIEDTKVELLKNIKILQQNYIEYVDK
jgi:hypothetical protein